MPKKRRPKARIVFVATAGQQALLEGDFTHVPVGTEYEACMPLATQMRIALLTVQAPAGGLAIAGVKMATESITPWTCLGWEVARVGECE